MVDLDEIGSIFTIDHLRSDEQLKKFWYSFYRKDGIVVHLTLSVYDNMFGVFVERDGTSFLSINSRFLKNLRVLDSTKLQIEIIYGNEHNLYRLFLSLNGDVVTIEELQ